MEHDFGSSAHLGVVQRLHVERAWSWSAAVHHIGTEIKLVLASWSRTSVLDALHAWLVAALAASTVSVSVDFPFSGTTDHSSGVLVVSILLLRSGFESGAAGLPVVGCEFDLIIEWGLAPNGSDEHAENDENEGLVLHNYC